MPPATDISDAWTILPRPTSTFFHSCSSSSTPNLPYRQIHSPAPTCVSTLGSPEDIDFTSLFSMHSIQLFCFVLFCLCVVLIGLCFAARSRTWRTSWMGQSAAGELKLSNVALMPRFHEPGRQGHPRLVFSRHRLAIDFPCLVCFVSAWFLGASSNAEQSLKASTSAWERERAEMSLQIQVRLGNTVSSRYLISCD